MHRLGSASNPKIQNPSCKMPPMRVLLSAEQIQSSIDRLAAEIREREAGRPLTVIAVMTGSIIFLADLIRKLDMPLRVGVIQARSYLGTERGACRSMPTCCPKLPAATCW